MSSLAERARNVKRHSDAAHLYAEAMMAGASPDSDAEGFDADQAQSELERRFEGIGAVADVGPDEYLRSRVPASLQESYKPRKRVPARRGERGEVVPAPSGGRSRVPARRGGGRRGRARARGRGAGAARALGLAGPARSATSSVLYVLGLVIVLAIVYDVVSAGNAPGLFLTGLSSFLDRIVSPVDPLGASKPSGSAPNPASTVVPDQHAVAPHTVQTPAGPVTSLITPGDPFREAPINPKAILPLLPGAPLIAKAK